jgi:hypothetical protein
MLYWIKRKRYKSHLTLVLGKRILLLREKYIQMNHALVVREKSIRNVVATKSANLYARIEQDVKE